MENTCGVGPLTSRPLVKSATRFALRMQLEIRHVPQRIQDEQYMHASFFVADPEGNQIEILAHVKN
jgi:hypothetical protein